MNKSDSERIAAVLENIGYKKTSNISEANLIVVNMCSVRQSAIDRVYGLLPKFKKLKAQNPNAYPDFGGKEKPKSLLTGCVLRKDLRKFEKHFDYILSIKTLPYWKDFLNPAELAKKQKFFNFPNRVRKSRFLSELKGSYYPDLRNPQIYKKLDKDYLKIKPKYFSDLSALVPISTGCNNFCTYCVVPYTRGLESSRPAKDILEQVEDLANQGFKEIWLLGQNVNSYQSPTDHSLNFAKLLKLINDIPGNFWIRFTSSHPKDFSDELINTIAECEKVTEYINLPVQSGDDKILKKMQRPYAREQYENLVKKIKKNISNVCLSTDVIVGFPGETKKQFRNTVKLFKKIKFDMAYIAKYSPRPQTAAFKLKDNVSKQEKEKRREFLTQVLRKTALENNKRQIGKTLEVLVEKEKNGFMIGKTRNYKTVKFKSNKNLIGQRPKVEIIEALPWGLKGKLKTLLS